MPTRYIDAKARNILLSSGLKLDNPYILKVIDEAKGRLDVGCYTKEYVVHILSSSINLRIIDDILNNDGISVIIVNDKPSFINDK